MNWSVAGCRARLERFDAHLDCLHDENGRYIKERPYEVVPEFEPDTRWHTIYLRTSAPPTLFGILVGEAAHQLRAVLDNIAWQLANLDGPVPPKLQKFIQFPIYSTEPSDFLGLRSLSGMRESHKAVLKEIQPYTARKQQGVPPDHVTALEHLAWINNTDKHKLIHVIASLADEVAPSILQASPGYKLVGSSFVEGRVMLEGKTEIGRVCIRPEAERLKMYMHGDMDVGVAFGDRDSPLYSVPADGALRRLKEGVEQIIALFDRPGANGSSPWP